MPRWMLTCPQCGHKFPHSQIDTEMIEQALRDPFHILPRPDFPAEGERRSCPSCKTESVFKPFELFYSDDRDARDDI
jgi:endogenous inhibitor of DNA gyrase (YacG/DUF329 family)